MWTLKSGRVLYLEPKSKHILALYSYNPEEPDYVRYKHIGNVLVSNDRKDYSIAFRVIVDVRDLEIIGNFVKSKLHIQTMRGQQET